MLNKKRARQIKHINNAQDIDLMGSKAWDIAEKVGVILHMVAFVLGTLSLIDIAINEESKHILEIVTLVVVGIILLQAFLKPLFKRIFLHNNLYELWGESRIKNNTYTINDTSITKDYKHSIIIKDKMITEENIFLGWYREKWYKNNKFVFQVFDENDNVLISILPRFIILDLELGLIKMTGYMTFPGTNDNKSRETNIEFNFDAPHRRVEKVAKWYGNFPEYPVFGEFTWTKKSVKLTKKAKEERKDR